MVEFGKDGRVTMGKYKGTYKVAGEKVSFAMTEPKESSFSVTITKLTDDQLVWEDDDKVIVVFKKVKADNK